MGSGNEPAGNDVNQRARVDYADQNESFAPLLPRSGELTRKLTDVHGNPDWFLLQLDEPLEYQLKTGDPYRFRLLKVSRFLLRSRWQGHGIGESEPTSVFILLVEDGEGDVPDRFDPSAYTHVAWGTCFVEE